MSSPDETPMRLWIIEDNRSLRDALAMSIHGHRPAWQLRGFPRCESALSQDVHEGPAVLLLDIGLPGMSGLEGIPLLRERWPPLEIIVFTVFDDADKIYSALCAGASGYLLKSETIGSVIQAIEEVRRGGSPMHPQVARKVLDRLSGKNRPAPETQLSDREQEVLQHMSGGLTKKEIAASLGLSIHTVDNYLRRIYRKLHVNTLQGAVAKALKEGLL